MPSEVQVQFNAAMERFERNPIYCRTKQLAAFFVVALQIVMLGLLWPQSIGVGYQLLTVAAAYPLADFVNGWVHLYMDNSANYASSTGPFYASFHLHHRTPKYRRRPILVVYYAEAGSKLWLAIVEGIVVLAIWRGVIGGVVGYLALYFSILSCVAEVSHYLCHVPPTKLGSFLARMRLLMASRYHARHHREDNVQYAFLNGMTDPLLDWIAKRYYSGYKSTTDTHYAFYRGTDTSNRS